MPETLTESSRECVACGAFVSTVRKGGEIVLREHGCEGAPQLGPCPCGNPLATLQNGLRRCDLDDWIGGDM